MFDYITPKTKIGTTPVPDPLNWIGTGFRQTHKTYSEIIFRGEIAKIRAKRMKNEEA